MRIAQKHPSTQFTQPKNFLKRAVSRLAAQRLVALFIGLGLMAALAWSVAPVSSGPVKQPGAVTVHAAGQGNPWIDLQDGREMSTTYAGGAGLQAGGQAQPLTLAAEDFDRDGAADLTIGYADGSGGLIALHRGNTEAVSPRSPETLQAIARGEFPLPFITAASTFDLPEAPDFLGTGDFNRDGSADIIAAARGGEALYLLAGDSQGGFSAAERIPLPGRATAMATGDINRIDGKAGVAVAVSGDQGSQLLIYDGVVGASAFATVAVSLPGEAAALALGPLNDFGLIDVAVAVGREVLIVHTGDTAPDSAFKDVSKDVSMDVERVGLPFVVRDLTLGNFVGDRDHRVEMAALADDGSVQILTRGRLDTRPYTEAELDIRQMAVEGDEKAEAAWSRIEAGGARRRGERLKWLLDERLEGAGSPSASARLISGQISKQPGDELLLLDPESQQSQIFVQTGDRTDESSSAGNHRTAVTLNVDGAPVAALPMRLNVTALPGLVMLRQGRLAPTIISPRIAISFTVNTTADTVDATPGNGVCADAGGSCSLRAAIQEANASAGADTITLGGATHTLALAGAENLAATGDLDIRGDVTIMGAGAGSSIIDGADIDRAFHINPSGNLTLTVSFSGVTIRNGSITGAGGGIHFDGFNSVPNPDTRDGVLNVTNCAVSDHQSSSRGGGIRGVDGTLNITNSTISNNTSTDGRGGGIDHAGLKPLVMSGCTVSGNQSLNGGAGDGIAGAGGGLRLLSGGITPLQLYTIQNSMISGNSATFDGGGIFCQAITTISNNTVISGNTAITQRGGGIYADLDATGGAAGDITLDGVTIKGNTAGLDGGGVFHDRDLLVIRNSTIGGAVAADKNQAVNGGGIATYRDTGAATDSGSINIINSVISANVATGNGGGLFNGLNATLNPGSAINVTGNTRFGGSTAAEGNSAANGGGVANNNGSITGAGAAPAGGVIRNNTATGNGAGVAVTGGSVNLSNYTLTDNSAAGSGGAFFVSGGVLTANLNRVVNNSAGGGSGVAQTGGAAGVENNWWGCDGFPSDTGCQTGSGTFDADPRVDLRLTPSPTTILIGGSSTLTADVSQNTNGAAITPFVLNGLTITFAGTLGTVAPVSATLSGLMATSTYTNSTCGAATVSATLDNGTQNATITVNEPPVIGACPANITANTDPGQCSAVVTFATPTATGCPAPVVTCVPASGSAFNTGVTTVTCTASNGVGTDSTCGFTVTVTDNQNPSITCPANITVTESPSGSGTATVNYTAPTGTDNCPGATTMQTAGLASGSAFPLGVTTNTFKVTDAAGNMATCSFTVTVVRACTLACPSNITVNNDPGQCGAVVNYAAPVPDSCPGATVIQTAGLASGALFPVGVTTNTFKVTDSSGAMATCTFTVTVVDNQNPSITCPANISVTENPPGSGTATVNYTAPVGTDNCPGATTMQTAGLASGSAFPLGTTTNTFKVTDAAGNMTTCSFTVTVAQACVISCPGNITVNNAPGQCGAAVNFAPTVTAGCGTVTCTPASGSFFPVGATPVTCTTGAGPSCSFTVTVIDAEAPQISLNPIHITLWPPNHKYRLVNVTDLVTGVSDNCTSLNVGNVVIAQVSSDEPENNAGPGDGNTVNDIVIANDCKSVQLRAERDGNLNGRVYTIVLQVSDAAGNVRTVTPTVTVPHDQSGGMAQIGPGPGYSVTSNCVLGPLPLIRASLWGRRQ